MVRVLYLRLVMGALNAFFVVAVAVVTLALALTISFRTLRSNAETSVRRLGQSTAASTDDFFVQPQRDMVIMSNSPNTFGPAGATFPSEHPTFTTTPSAPGGFPGGELVAQYRRAILATMQRSSFRYLSMVVNFLDGTFSLSLQTVTPVGRVFMHSWLVPTGPLPFNQTARVATVHTLDTGNYSAPLTAMLAPVWNLLPPSDTRYPPNRALFDYAFATSDVSPGTRVGWHDSYFVSFAGEDYFFMFLYALISNGTQQLGAAQLGIRTADISKILTAGKLTPASNVFVFDEDKYLFGASEGLSVFTTANYSLGDTVPSGCATTDQSKQFVPSDRVILACRHHISTVPLLGDAYQKDPSVFSPSSSMESSSAATSSTSGGLVKLIGTQYVFVKKLSTIRGRRALTIALVVPEADMIGDAGSILPLCAGVTAGVVVFVAAISFVLVWAVLRPLEGIAVQMAKAARLESDDAAVNISALVEIGDLQRSFVEMRDELSRIRAFVPQSLLRRSSDDDDDDYDAEEYDDELTGEPSGALSNSGQLEAVSTITSPLENGLTPPSANRSRAASLSLNSPGHPLNFTSPRKQHGGGGRGQGQMFGQSNSVDTGSETASASGRSRIARSVVGAGRARRGGLRMDNAVRRENVSVLQVNFRNFHRSVARCGGLAAVGKTVQNVLALATAEKGVVDSFHGDRFLISFNAVKPAANHAIRASLVAARLAKMYSGADADGNEDAAALSHEASLSHNNNSSAPISSRRASNANAKYVAPSAVTPTGAAARANPPQLRPQGSHHQQPQQQQQQQKEGSLRVSAFSGLAVTCGVASGPAFVGNVGCDELRRFSIVGFAVTQATILERMCKLYTGAKVLVPQRVHEDIRTAVASRVVDCVRLPGMAAPCLIAEASRELAANAVEDEWMYQLAAAAAAGSGGGKPKKQSDTAAGATNTTNAGKGNQGDGAAASADVEPCDTGRDMETANGVQQQQQQVTVSPEDAAIAATDAWTLLMRAVHPSSRNQSPVLLPAKIPHQQFPAVAALPSVGAPSDDVAKSLGHVFDNSMAHGVGDEQQTEKVQQAQQQQKHIGRSEMELRRCLGVVSAFEAQDASLAHRVLHGYAPRKAEEGPATRLERCFALAQSGAVVTADGLARDFGEFYAGALVDHE